VLTGDDSQSITALRADDMGEYVAVDCQIDRRSQVNPEAQELSFECLQCGSIMDVPQSGTTVTEPGECTACERQGPFEIVDRRGEYQDYQWLKVSDPPEQTGSSNDQIGVHVYDDLAGHVDAGDRVTIHGIAQTKSLDAESNPSRARPIELQAKAIEHDDTGFHDIEPDDVDAIEELSEDPDLFDKLINSIAPHIVTDGHGDTIKLALALQLFGGVERDTDTAYKRGNINVLLVGRPGTAKSDYLTAVNKLAPKSTKVSGKAAKPAGMTATATRDEVTGDWTLQAGALPKASGGIACIDEFDKMQTETKQSLHEALEDQEISVAKATINATVPAKCAVLGAANPAGMEFDRFESLSEQIDLDSALISRFDLIYHVRDPVEEDRDREVAQQQHDAADPNRPDPEPAIDPELLTQYIAYARQNVNPTYADDDVRDALVEFYVGLRQDTAGDNNDDGVRPVGARINELLRRLAQASARARLSDEITQTDVDRVKELFKQTLGEVGLDENGNVDGGQLRGESQQEKVESIEDALRGNGMMSISELAEELDMDAHEVEQRVGQLAAKGEVYEPQTNHFRLT